jgi:hypothetical protein
MSESINYWLIRFGSVYPLFLHHQPPPPTSSLYLVSVPITCRRHHFGFTSDDASHERNSPWRECFTTRKREMQMFYFDKSAPLYKVIEFITLPLWQNIVSK